MAEPADPIVYVIDDDEAVRDSLKLLLESYGMAVADYESVAAFRQGREPGRRACMVLDLHLPEVSGLDYLAARDPADAVVPVIMITGRADAASRARAQQMGVRAFLDKPVSAELLVASIERALAAG